MSRRLGWNLLQEIAVEPWSVISISMKTSSFSLVSLLASLVTAGVHAQTGSTSPAAIAASTAPVIQATSTPPLPPAPAPAGVPNQVVYTPRLPSPTELSNAAVAQGTMLERIEQTPTQVIAVFKHPQGISNTVSYQLLPPSGTPTTQVVVQEQRPTVIYRESPRVIYYDDYPRYYSPYPYRWYPPFSVHLGIGHGHSYRRGGYRR